MLYILFNIILSPVAKLATADDIFLLGWGWHVPAPPSPTPIPTHYITGFLTVVTIVFNTHKQAKSISYFVQLGDFFPHTGMYVIIIWIRTRGRLVPSCFFTVYTSYLFIRWLTWYFWKYAIIQTRKIWLFMKRHKHSFQNTVITQKLLHACYVKIMYNCYHVGGFGKRHQYPLSNISYFSHFLTIIR